MKPLDSAGYRVSLARGFLAESRQDQGWKRWRSCVDNAQLAVEHALKAIIALWGPVPKTHHVTAILLRMLEQGQLPQEYMSEIRRLISLAEPLGPEIHLRTDYGDELSGISPWELFSKEDAQHYLDLAEQAVYLAGQLIERVASE